ISDKPLYTINSRHLISEVISLCGGRNIFAGLQQLAPPVSAEAVLERDPEVVMTGDGAQGDPLSVWRRWPTMRAVRLNNLYTVHADFLARPTVRVVQGAREVCRALDEARAKRARVRPGPAAHRRIRGRGRRTGAARTRCRAHAPR